MVGGFEETFARGAFKRCLNEDPDVVLLINHEGLPLARTKSGTMTLTEDARGLKVDADLDPSDLDVQTLVPKLRRGDLTEMSFSFKANDDEWSERDTKRLVRSATIHKGDVSVVTHGANTATSGGIRSAVEELERRARGCRNRQERAEIEATIRKLEWLDPDGAVRAAQGGASRSAMVIARARMMRHGGGAPTREPDRVMPGTGVAAARQQRARSAQRALGDLVLSPFGPDWEIGSGPDVHKAVLAVEVGHAKGPREAAIKAWIYERAEELAAPDSVPASWKGNWKPTRSSAVTQARRAKRRV